MAMRPRGSEANPKRPQRTIIGRVYESFKPISEWQQEDDCHRLLIYLPGFLKEFIKITFEYPKKLRVRGERLVAGNKWNRFREDFEVPKNCKMSEIRAIFDGGILIVTIPRKISDAPIATTTAAALKSKKPMKKAEQDHTNLAKPSSSSALDAIDQTHRLQSLAANHGDLQPPLGRAKPIEGVNNKIEYKIGVAAAVVVAATLVVALGVYVSYAINGSLSYMEVVKQYIDLN